MQRARRHERLAPGKTPALSQRKLPRMDKPAVYLETSVISYLSNRLSRDLIVAGHQATTREWWEYRRNDFVLYVSEPVLDEASAGDAEAASKRLAMMDDIEVLSVTDEAIEFAAQLLRLGIVRKKRQRTPCM
jgi:hypothetical protein